MRPAAFNIRLWFGLTGFVVIATMGVAFALLMANFLTNHMLRREVEVTSEFLESVVLAEHSMPLLFTGGGIDTNAQLASLTDHIREIRDVMRANIYGPDRRIVWSTDMAVLGHHFATNPELERAFGGELVAEMGSLSANAKDEHFALGEGTTGVFMEAYIPLRDGLGNVRGVIELYKVPDALDAVLRDARNAIWVSAMGGALIVYLALYWIVRRGAKLIERQHAELAHMETMAVLGQMAGVIAHSLRNPIATIRGTTELMRYDFPEVEQPASEIIGEVNRLDAHVRDLLNYSRLDAPAATEVDPLESVDHALSRSDVTLRRTGIVTRIDDARPPTATVWAEAGLLSQAMNSILANAIDAMPKGGDLTVRLESYGRRELRIGFTDTGKGIPPDMLPRLGEPFSTSKSRGLGLGLALSKRIVERFGGRLEVASPPGRGATVSLVLVRR